MNYPAGELRGNCVAQTRAKKREKAEAADLGPSANPASRHFAAEIGRLVRRSRARRGLTRRQLAEESGISERYLAQIEGGQGNPSVIVLRTIAQAMDMHITALLPAGGKRHEAIARIDELLGRLDVSELPRSRKPSSSASPKAPPRTGPTASHWSACAGPARPRWVRCSPSG
jgi:transcriptional regulator with XRE-family HTH domain